MGMTLLVECGQATQVERSAREVLYSEDYSSGIDRLSRAGKYTANVSIRIKGLSERSSEMHSLACFEVVKSKGKIASHGTPLTASFA